MWYREGIEEGESVSKYQRGGEQCGGKREEGFTNLSGKQAGNDNATADEVNAMDNYADELDEL